MHEGIEIVRHFISEVVDKWILCLQLGSVDRVSEQLVNCSWVCRFQTDLLSILIRRRYGANSVDNATRFGVIMGLDGLAMWYGGVTTHAIPVLRISGIERSRSGGQTISRLPLFSCGKK